MTRIGRIATALAMVGGVLVAIAGAMPEARAQSGPPNPSFNLVNKSPQVIKELFATPAGFDNWGRNRLDGKTIAAGASFAVRLPANGNCRYDIRVVTTDGAPPTTGATSIPARPTTCCSPARQAPLRGRPSRRRRGATPTSS